VNRRAGLVKVSLLSALLSGTIVVGLAAQDSGAIAGRVSDTFGYAVSGASIQIKNTATGALYRTVSAATGEYALSGVSPGAYQLSVTMTNMKDYVRQDVAVGSAQRVRVDVTLQDDVRLGTLGDGGRFAQRRRPPPPVGPTPRMGDGKPDLSGFWAPAPADPSESVSPQGLPWVEAAVKERIANDLRDMPTARCLPNGVTAQAGRGKFVQTSTLLVMLVEFPGDTRQVFLDGRAHPKDMEPTWLGHSIGRWEADTLVVDTVGFNDKSWLTMIRIPYPHTEMMHVIERYRRPDMGHLELEMTVEDPGAFKKPWIVKRAANLDPTDELMENICVENEKDQRHLSAK
jgi:Carboxypeptidase regulatory-like domain